MRVESERAGAHHLRWLQFFFFSSLWRSKNASEFVSTLRESCFALLWSDCVFAHSFAVNLNCLHWASANGSEEEEVVLYVWLVCMFVCLCVCVWPNDVSLCVWAGVTVCTAWFRPRSELRLRIQLNKCLSIFPFFCCQFVTTIFSCSTFFTFSVGYTFLSSSLFKTTTAAAAKKGKRGKTNNKNGWFAEVRGRKESKRENKDEGKKLHLSVACSVLQVQRQAGMQREKK